MVQPIYGGNQNGYRQPPQGQPMMMQGQPRPQQQQPPHMNASGFQGQPANNDSILLGNQIFPFQCDCGQGLHREREIQQHSSCGQFTAKYCNLLQAFVTLKQGACTQASTLRSYQAKMSLFTLLTSFRADIKEHLNREQQALIQMGLAPPKPPQSAPVQQPMNRSQAPQQPMQQMMMPPQQQPVQQNNFMGGGAAAAHGGGAAAYNNFPEEVKHQESDAAMMNSQVCVYCMAEVTDADMTSGKVQMFLADGCFHQFHIDCFRTYAKKTLLTRAPSGDFLECKCKQCGTLVQADDLREALGVEWIQGIREQQTKLAMADQEGLVQCPSCNEVFGYDPSEPNYAQRDENGKVVSRETAEHMARNRVRCGNCAKNFCVGCKKEPYHIGMSCEEAENHRVALKCRFCWDPLTEPSISQEDVFADVCRKPDCINLMNKSCNKTHACGHKCRGFRGERRCLPCLNPECISTHNEQYVDFQLYEDYNEEQYCGICMISGLADEPSIMLGCKHIFHVECIKKRVFGRWPSPRITWDFLNCSACKQQIDIQPDHIELHTELTKLLEMKRKLYGMSIERAKYEGIDKSERLRDPNDNYYNDLQSWALFKLAYYQCFKCKNPYFGGMKDCIAAQAAQQEFKPEELVCAQCSSQQLGLGNTKCKKHGLDFIEFKCKFCCSISQWFCWGNTHFCEPCHKRQCNGDYVSRKKASELPQCPGKENCPLKVAHPPNGTEFSLGCAICRNENANIKNF